MREQILELLRERDGYVSGQEISERFGVSRTSVWKAVRQLTEMGYEIRAVRNRGYRLLSEPDRLTKERITEHLAAQWAGCTVLVLDSVDSTNNEAKRRAEEGAPAGLLVVSEEQTAGRGRRGRTWASARGEGLFMSLLLRPDIAPGNASMLTLVMGMAVCDALREACASVPEKADGTKEADDPRGREFPDIRIKWPNDIVIGGKKVCGILTEMSAEPDCVNYVVIGVGINVHDSSFPENVVETATSVFLQTGAHPARAELAAACMRHFEEYYALFSETQDMSGLICAYEARLINCGRRVCIEGGSPTGAACGSGAEDGILTGTARGINARGELLVDTPDGEIRVSSGEVSVRGVYGYT